MHGRQKCCVLPLSKVWLDRFMINEKYQGNGYAKQIFPKILSQLQEEYNTNKIYLSVNERNLLARKLYENSGFKKKLFKDSNGEIIMRCYSKS